MWTSTVVTGAIGTNWVMTLRMSTVHVGDLGSYITIQLGYRSLTRRGSACFAFWLAGSCVLDLQTCIKANKSILINPSLCPSSRPANAGESRQTMPRALLKVLHKKGSKIVIFRFKAQSALVCHWLVSAK